MNQIEFQALMEPLSVKETDGVSLFTFQLNGEAAGVCTSFRIPELKRFLANYMIGLKIWWQEPAYGFECREIPDESQMLLARLTDRSWLLLIPMLQGDVRASLRGTPDNTVELYFAGTLKRNPQKSGMLLAAAAGPDPFALIRKTVKVIRNELNTFKLREEKSMPDFLKQFGWCTWDAFYHAVSEKKIMEGLQSFKDGGIVPEFLILDDGWQTASDSKRLVCFDAVKEKFPGNLKQTIQLAKENFGVKCFAVWHAFEGYWRGIINSPLLPYKTVTTRCLTGGTDPENPAFPNYDEFSFVHPDDAARFFDDFHTFLKAQGVDMLKVDNQGALTGRFIQDAFARGPAERAYQDGLQNSAVRHFNNQLIHCMSNGSDIFFNLTQGNVLRNSDDYYPRKPLKVQLHHLHTNAKNAFYSSNFVWPDWDMFQSASTGAAVHSAARAVSGGPVYVSDRPEAHDFDMLRRLIDRNGVLLRPDRPALPSADCLLVDVENDHFPLKLSNRSGDAGLLALFNCCTVEPDRIHAFWQPSDISDLPDGNEFAVLSFRTGSVKRMARDTESSVVIGNEEFELLTIAPVKYGFAALGSDGKYIGHALFESVEYRETELMCHVRCGGDFIFYAENRPSAVLVQDKSVPFEYSNGKLCVSVDLAAPAVIRILQP